MKLSESMRSLLWDMLQHRKNPGNTVLIINDERTADALVRRGLLTKSSTGYQIDEKSARKALARESAS